MAETENYKIAIVGTGNFAIDLHALCSSYGMEIVTFIDEFREESFIELPVIKASQLSSEQIESIDKFIIAISSEQYSEAAKNRLVSVGCYSECILQLRGDTDLHILRYLFDAYGNSAVDGFISKSINTIEALEECFLEEHWANVTSSLENGKQTIGVGLYARGSGFKEHIEPLIPLLINDYNVLTLSDEDLTENLPKDNHLFMGAETAKKKNLADLVISASHTCFAPKHTPRVSLSHMIYDFSASDIAYVNHIESSDIHYIFASSVPCFNYYKSVIEHYDLKNRVCLIPGGYPRLDRNVERVDSYKGPVDSIVYAPTYSLVNYEGHELASSIAYAKDILEALVENFPNYRVIFRPHPSDLKLFQLKRSDSLGARLADAIEYCEKTPSCFLDGRSSGYMDTMCRSQVMVSDVSSTIYTFPFSTKRPVVFFSPNDALMQERIQQGLGGKSFVRDRSRVGAVVANTDEMVQAVSDYIKNEKQSGEYIDDFRKSMIFNFGKSKDYFYNNIKNILNDTPNSEWSYFNW